MAGQTHTLEVSEGWTGSGELAGPVPVSRHEAGLGNAPLWFFSGRHKLWWPGVKELKLLLALDTAAALDDVCAFLRWALRGSHLLTRWGDIPNALFICKNGAQAPKAPQKSSDLRSCWKVLLWVCWMLSSLNSWVFAPQRGL